MKRIISIASLFLLLSTYLTPPNTVFADSCNKDVLSITQIQLKLDHNGNPSFIGGGSTKDSQGRWIFKDSREVKDDRQHIDRTIVFDPKNDSYTLEQEHYVPVDGIDFGNLESTRVSIGTNALKNINPDSVSAGRFDTLFEKDGTLKTQMANIIGNSHTNARVLPKGEQDRAPKFMKIRIKTKIPNITKTVRDSDTKSNLIRELRKLSDKSDGKPMTYPEVKKHFADAAINAHYPHSNIHIFFGTNVNNLTQEQKERKILDMVNSYGNGHSAFKEANVTLPIKFRVPCKELECSDASYAKANPDKCNPMQTPKSEIGDTTKCPDGSLPRARPNENARFREHKMETATIIVEEKVGHGHVPQTVSVTKNKEPITEKTKENYNNYREVDGFNSFIENGIYADGNIINYAKTDLENRNLNKKMGIEENSDDYWGDYYKRKNYFEPTKDDPYKYVPGSFKELEPRFEHYNDPITGKPIGKKVRRYELKLAAETYGDTCKDYDNPDCKWSGGGSPVVIDCNENEYTPPNYPQPGQKVKCVPKPQLKGTQRCPDKGMYKNGGKHLRVFLYSTNPREYIETNDASELFKPAEYCDESGIQDNIGFKFWNLYESGRVANNSKSETHVGYVLDNGNTSNERYNRFAKFIEYQGFYPDTEPGLQTALRLDSESGQKTITGLPTYERWGEMYEKDYITKSSQSVSLGVQEGMTPLEKGWYGEENIGQEIYHDGQFHAPLTTYETRTDGEPEVHKSEQFGMKWTGSESPIVDARYVKNQKYKIFKNTPLGRFKFAFIDVNKTDTESTGAPIWTEDENITRYCQYKAEALTKFKRKEYVDFVYQYYKIYNIKTFYEKWEPYDCNCSKDSDGNRSCSTCWRFEGCVLSSDTDYLVECKELGSCGHKSYGIKGDTYKRNELPGNKEPKEIYDFMQACSFKQDIPAEYAETRQWNYRKFIDTEFHGYAVPDDGNVPNNNKSDAGNNLKPFKGNRTNPDKIKSGYGVTYQSGLKIFSDWGKDSHNAELHMVTDKLQNNIGGAYDTSAMDGNSQFSSSNSYTQLIRPNLTVTVPKHDEDSILMSIVNNDSTVSQVGHGVHNAVKPNKSSSPNDSLYIRDALTQTSKTGTVMNNTEITNPGEGAKPNSNVDGHNYPWKAGGGVPAFYGTDKSYYHSYKKTKLEPELIPSGSKAKQHFIHVDYPNDEYNAGSIVDVQFFKSAGSADSDGSGQQIHQHPVNVNGKQMIPTLRLRFGNYSGIDVKGNMYEDSFTSPSAPRQ